MDGKQRGSLGAEQKHSCQFVLYTSERSAENPGRVHTSVKSAEYDGDYMAPGKSGEYGYQTAGWRYFDSRTVIRIFIVPG